MSEHVKLNDNPSVETQLYVMGGAINRLLESSNEHSRTLAEIRLLQREQNGNVALALGRISKLESRSDAHDDWHGEQDEELLKRNHLEELAEAEKRGEQKGIKKVLGIEVNAVKWVAGGGLVGVGLAAGKIINLIGVW